jgi:hypothetical protein
MNKALLKKGSTLSVEQTRSGKPLVPQNTFLGKKNYTLALFDLGLGSDDTLLSSVHAIIQLTIEFTILAQTSQSTLLTAILLTTRVEELIHPYKLSHMKVSVEREHSDFVVVQLSWMKILQTDGQLVNFNKLLSY